MPFIEKVSLGILIGLMTFGLMILSYKSGVKDANVDNKSYTRTIIEQQKLTEMYKNLYKDCTIEKEIYVTDKRKREKLLLEIYMLNVKLERKLDSISKKYGR
jgi:hypothetical protein